MPRFHLTNAAKNDLLEIARYGDEHFGVEQSDRYREELKRRFALIAEKPLLYPTVNYIREGYRRSVCGAHSIYYTIDGANVKIVRLLKRQDSERALGGEAK